MKNPLFWPFERVLAKSELSPLRIVWHPSRRDIWRWKSWRILINASLRPGISNPFLIRRIKRMGSISAPTFSSRPRMKATRSEFRAGFDCHRLLAWTCFSIFEKVFPKVIITLLFSELDGLEVVNSLVVCVQLPKHVPCVHHLVVQWWVSTLSCCCPCDRVKTPSLLQDPYSCTRCMPKGCQVTGLLASIGDEPPQDYTKCLLEGSRSGGVLQIRRKA